MPTEKSSSPPVLFIIFNRPETTAKVFEAIRKAKPPRLYVAADGPREGRPGELERCEACRKIASGADWDCDVHTLFRDTNLGCGAGPATAISWFFEHEPEGIILEDDCLPSPSFFAYCGELLERYRHDTRIMEIAGNNLEEPHLRVKDYSYSFSGFTYSWGWASWRRAWRHHDFQMKHYLEINRKGYLNKIYESIYERDFFQYVFGKMYKGDEQTNRKNIWDYQWQFACRINSGLIIVPGKNLVRNLGFGEHATNTTNPNGAGHNLRAEDVEFPLKHPEFVMVEKAREKRTFALAHTSRKSRLKSDIKRVIPRPLMEKVIRPFLYLMFTSA